MDPISQGALGAIAAASVALPEKVRQATLVGWAAGMLADADIFIRSESDPLMNIEYHRHFSHSLLFIPVGGLIAALVFWMLFRRRVAFRELFLYAVVGYATGGLLDACTSYGTRLLWPFSDMRVAWNIISIIDPVFTGTILVLIAVGVWRKSVKASRVAWGFALFYFAFGFVQNHRAMNVLEGLAENRGHETASRFTAKPSIGSLVLWRGIYEYGDRIYVDAIRVSYVGGEAKVYPGTSVEKVEVAEERALIGDGSVLAYDIERFDHFSDGYLSRHPEDPLVLGDARYALMPDSVYPLWGIEVDATRADEHAPFISFRSADQRQVDRLWLMMRGEEL